MVRAGRLTELATFQRQSQASELEDKTASWQTLRVAMIGLEPLTARELLNSQQVQGQTTHKATAHWFDGLEPRDRIRIQKKTLPVPDNLEDESNFRYLNIESVINVREQNRELELLCIEVV